MKRIPIYHLYAAVSGYVVSFVSFTYSLSPSPSLYLSLSAVEMGNIDILVFLLNVDRSGGVWDEFAFWSDAPGTV